MIDKEKVEQAVRELLRGLGVDSTDHNFFDTPQRVAKMYAEIFEPPELKIPTFDEHFTDMVVMRGHEFYTMCPHHLLPVKVKAAVAYIPDGKVIGASKLIRIIHDCNRYPMTQEKLTAQIICGITRITAHTSQGEAVLLAGQHGCMQVRGVKSLGSEMLTVKFSGKFQEQVDLQNRFYSLAGHI